jgi:hypothetical protein
MSGTTANRPTKRIVDRRMYFDTTLGFRFGTRRPVWMWGQAPLSGIKRTESEKVNAIEADEDAEVDMPPVITSRKVWSIAREIEDKSCLG